MFVPLWIIIVVATIGWITAGIGMTKLYQKLLDDGSGFELVAPFLVLFWPVLIVGIPFGLLMALTDKIFAK